MMAPTNIVRYKVLYPKNYCIHFLVNKDGSCFQCGMPKSKQTADLIVKDAKWHKEMERLSKEYEKDVRKNDSSRN